MHKPAELLAHYLSVRYDKCEFSIKENLEFKVIYSIYVHGEKIVLYKKYELPTFSFNMLFIHFYEITQDFDRFVLECKSML